MSPISNGSSRPMHPKDSHSNGEKAKWVLIAAGALLSSLSIRLGYILKHALDGKAKDHGHASTGTSINGNLQEKRVFDESRTSSKIYSFPRDETGCFTCIVGNEDALDANQSIIMMAPDHQEKSNSSESLCMSESVSEIFTKREVLQKMRAQLKKRDEMILEMQAQIVELENSLSSQLSHSSRLQSLLDTANRGLFDSNREIQTLRKVVADHCIISHVAGRGSGNGESAGGRPWIVLSLKEEVGELKEVIEGKDYLLRSYKEQKEELSLKLKEVQGKLNSQLQIIL